MVGDSLDWVGVFGCGLEMCERDCTWAGVDLIEQEWAKNEQEWAKASGYRWQ